MAAFREHVTFSTVIGMGYATSAYYLGTSWPLALLSGAACGIAGMLPDLDSASGRPTRELFGVTSCIVPLLLTQRLANAGLSPDETILLAGLVYLLIRFFGQWLLDKLTVHRGMFHSIPAAAIAAMAVFLAYHGSTATGRLLLAGGVLLGFLSHLVLDEIYSVDLRGVKIELNKAAGSALKFFSKNRMATATCWLLLAASSYFVCVDQGMVEPVHLRVAGFIMSPETHMR